MTKAYKKYILDRNKKIEDLTADYAGVECYKHDCLIAWDKGRDFINNRNKNELIFDVFHFNIYKNSFGSLRDARCFCDKYL